MYHLNSVPDPAFHFNVDLGPIFTLIRIRLRIIFYFNAGPDSTYPAFDFDADLDSAFHSEAEPDLNLACQK